MSPRPIDARACLFALLLALGPGPATASDARVPAAGSDECEVWQRELSFAAAFERRDMQAFAAHLHPGAVFALSTAAPTRGADAVRAEWEPLVTGDAMRFQWYPTHVTHAEGTNLATSSGPVLTERPGHANNRWLVSRYSTVWERGRDGVWRVLFDDGTAPRPASDAEIAQFRAGRRSTCAA